jgi:hypothetical protein
VVIPRPSLVIPRPSYLSFQGRPICHSEAEGRRIFPPAECCEVADGLRSASLHSVPPTVWLVRCANGHPAGPSL